MIEFVPPGLAPIPPCSQLEAALAGRSQYHCDLYTRYSGWLGPGVNSSSSTPLLDEWPMYQALLTEAHEVSFSPAAALKLGVEAMLAALPGHGCCCR